MIHGDLRRPKVLATVVAGGLGNAALPPAAFSEFTGLGFFAADRVDRYFSHLFADLPPGGCDQYII